MGRREALIVATGQYQDKGLRKLRSPAQDATALSRVLSDRRIGDFHVEQVIDETEASIRRALHRFFSDRRRDDLLLVHLSCHGIKDDEGRLYFAGTDTTRQALEVTAVSAAFLNDQMERCRARSIMLLLDCCYAGAFATGSKGDEGVHLKEKFEGHGRAILTASNAIEYSWEGDTLSGQGQPSVFTSAIIKGLQTGDADRDGDGRVSFYELHEYVTDRMLAAVPKQTPLKWELGIQGGLYVARNPRPRPALPREVLEALEHPLPGVRAGVASDLARLLVSAQPTVKRAARHALEQLLADDSHTVRQAAAQALDLRGHISPGVPVEPSDGDSQTHQEPPDEREVEREEDWEGDPEPVVGPDDDRRRPRTLAEVVAEVVSRPAVLIAVVAALLVAGVAFSLISRGVPVAREQTVVVSALQDWTDTRVDLEAGEEVTITATGTVCDDRTRPGQCYDPEGVPDTEGRHPGDPYRDMNHAALVGRIGEDGAPFEVGAAASFPAPRAGRLYLGVNDGRFDDNEGAYQAVVGVTSR